MFLTEGTLTGIHQMRSETGVASVVAETSGCTVDEGFGFLLSGWLNICSGVPFLIAAIPSTM